VKKITIYIYIYEETSKITGKLRKWVTKREKIRKQRKLKKTKWDNTRTVFGGDQERMRNV
jgi:hypothetical protein